MKILLTIVVSILIMSCDKRLDELTAIDGGKLQIGPNTFIRRIDLDKFANEKIYILVDSTDHLISGNVSFQYPHGKTSKSSAFLVK